jgi:hypothetical protein
MKYFVWKSYKKRPTTDFKKKHSKKRVLANWLRNIGQLPKKYQALAVLELMGLIVIILISMLLLVSK